MALGWGFLKQMNDTLKYNRDIVAKKKSTASNYKERIRKQTPVYNEEALDSVRQRVEHALKRNSMRDLSVKYAGIVIVVIVVASIIWVMTFDFSGMSNAKYKNTASLFTTVLYTMPNGMQLKTDYFVHGPKAAETYLKDGRKHQNAESYYESGEQFRSALYYYDTLVREIYFYKNGDTLLNFPKLSGDKVYTLNLFHERQGLQIEFDFFDEKIIQGTYKEKSIGGAN